MHASSLIAENLEFIKNRMVEAAKKAGRDPESIRLVVVTKGVPVEKIMQARDAGAVLFGENRVQEALEKIDRMGGIHWHFIGHLQKNKVKFVVGQFEWVHSVDSVSLAEGIHKISLERNRVTRILIQVNISGEVSKFGMAPEKLEETLRAVSKFDGIRVGGLMAIPPFDPDPEKSRKYFIRLRQLRDQCAGLGLDNISLDELSMGMSNDYSVAIEEGATMVRVGTAIFGSRSAHPA